jgi:hypothetical protein
MYLVYSITLAILILILILIWMEEIRFRKSISHGIANKYWMLRERRHFVRFKDEIKIRYNIIGSKLNGNGKTNNISRAGLCISTYEKLKEKDAMELEITVPGFPKPVKLIGRIVWIKELHSPDSQGRRLFYTGISFHKINPESEAILLTHLNTLKRPPDDYNR